jgi:hypothetical protein
MVSPHRGSSLCCLWLTLLCLAAAARPLTAQTTTMAPRIHTFTVPLDIEKGESGFLPPDSANLQVLAATGRIFTVSIRE